MVEFVNGNPVDTHLETKIVLLVLAVNLAQL